MEQHTNTRAQQTRERIRAAARRLFLRQGYLATSMDAILAEASISSKETLYRHYTNKEELFADVLRHLTLQRPDFSERLTTLPAPHDLPSLRHALTQIAREILALMSQPDYLALVRMIIAEAPRFPDLGALFFEAVPLTGISIVTALLRQAREQDIIADVDFDVVARLLLGGLLSYAIPNLVSAEKQLRAAPPDRADALVDMLIRTLTPR